MSSTANMMRRMPSVFAGTSFGSGLIAFGVLNIANSIPPWPSGVRSIATSCRTSSIPITRSTQLPRSALALQLHPELDEERNDGVKVLDNDEDVVHPVDRHAGSPWALLGHGPHPHRAEAARPISTTLARVYRGNFLTQHRSSNVLRIDGAPPVRIQGGVSCSRRCRLGRPA
jgi:hypothetical protein